MTSYDRCPEHGTSLQDFDSAGQRLARPTCYACLYQALPSVRREMVRVAR